MISLRPPEAGKNYESIRMYELMKKRKKILFVTTLFCGIVFFGKNIPTAHAMTSAQCTDAKGSCDLTCWSSDYESLGMCDYGVYNCCRKKLVDTSGDPDPKGKGNFATGACGSSGEGTCKFSIAIGGTICGDDKNIGQDICSWSYSCCVPKTNVGVGVTNPTTGNPTTGASPTTPAGTVANPSGTGSAANAQSVPNGGLVPCGLGSAADCTLCHLVLGFKNIYDYLLVLLLSATTLVVVVAGVMYMVSSGDKGMIDKAKSALTYAITAMILALVAWLIINATLSALGYTKVGSWYNFTCDTTQTQGPTGGMGGGTLPGTGGGSGSYKASGYLSPKAQEVINNYMNTQVGKSYGGNVHCYSTTDAAYTLSGLQDLGGRWKAWDGDPNSIKPGDAMQTSKHTWLVMENGVTSNAIPGGKIGVNPDGLNYNLNKAKNLGLQVKIIHVN